MITAVKLAEFAEQHGWIVIESRDEENGSYLRFLTPSGRRVLVEYNKNGSIRRIYP